MAASQTCVSVRELPGRYDAERTLSNAVEDGRRVFAAVVIARKALELAEQLGYEHAEDAVLNCGLALSGVGPVWRWSGLALLTLCDDPSELAPLGDIADVRTVFVPCFEDPAAIMRSLDLEAALAIAGQ